MKKTLVLLLFLLTLTLSQNAIAQTETVADIVEQTWTGYSRQETSSGYFYCQQSFTFRLNRSTNSLSGSVTATLKIDGVSYSSRYTLTGQLYEDDNKLYYNAEYSSGDALPGGAEWCGSNGYLNFYSNPDKYGHFSLQGTVSSCGGSLDLDLGDD